MLDSQQDLATCGADCPSRSPRLSPDRSRRPVAPASWSRHQGARAGCSWCRLEKQFSRPRPWPAFPKYVERRRRNYSLFYPSNYCASAGAHRARFRAAGKCAARPRASDTEYQQPPHLVEAVRSCGRDIDDSRLTNATRSGYGATAHQRCPYCSPALLGHPSPDAERYEKQNH